MSEIVKWGLLVAGILVLVGSVVGIFSLLNLGLVASGLMESVGGVIGVLSTVFQAGRGVLNTLAPYWVWDILLAIPLLYPLMKLSTRVIGWLYSWIFK